jgi:hypothetical protein
MVEMREAEGEIHDDDRDGPGAQTTTEELRDALQRVAAPDHLLA